eukprot:1178832-Prorocentrum_minimum.AAC.2
MIPKSRKRVLLGLTWRAAKIRTIHTTAKVYCFRGRSASQMYRESKVGTNDASAIDGDSAQANQMYRE